mmetsp:Transcript_25888/g.64682  ORF Transcript_25888/g.64682 Transcript_25888/m.64682 type:complete len:207 (+) Transcript_25888:1220-1840(+)
MDHDAGVREGHALALLAGGEEEGGHGGGEADVDGDDLGFDVLHGVEHGHAGDDGAAGGVDVEVDGLGVVLALQVEHDGDDLVRDLVINLLPEENNALAIQPVVDIHPIGLLRARHAVRHLGDADRHHADGRVRRGALLLGEVENEVGGEEGERARGGDEGRGPVLADGGRGRGADGGGGRCGGEEGGGEHGRGAGGVEEDGFKVVG